jgi:G3E family GTPase
MQFDKLHPNFSADRPAEGMQEILRNILIQTNFIPNIRHLIGWRGLKDASTSVEGWTAKIKKKKGVYGICFKDVKLKKGWIVGRFAVNYFPDKNEEMIDFFSLQAGIITQQADYSQKVRNFLLYQEYCDLFNLGTIYLSVNMSEKIFLLELKASSRQRSIYENGITISSSDGPVELIAPGGFDEDLPAYGLAFRFFEVLAASATFNLKQSPSFLGENREYGKVKVFNQKAVCSERISQKIQERFLNLGWGKGSCDEIIKFKKKEEKYLKSPISWKEGCNKPHKYENQLWWNAHEINNFESIKKNTPTIDQRPELIMITGFLGSGKTSFLKRFIEYQAGMNRFVAIIQNEIGEVGLDGKLLDQEYAVTEMDEGCVCCSLVGNLKTAIKNILANFHPDYIILETTGLANPYNLLDELPELSDITRFNSVTTLVDGLNIIASLKKYKIAHEQIKSADVLILNKKDLLTKKKLHQVYTKIREINPNAPILPTSFGDINPGFLYEIDQIKSTGKLSKLFHAEHCYTHKNDMFSSVKIAFEKPVEKERFFRTLNILPKEIFRMKGIIEFEDSKSPMLLQYVAGRYEISKYAHPDSAERFIVAIGQNLQKNLPAEVFQLEN